MRGGWGGGRGGGRGGEGEGREGMGGGVVGLCKEGARAVRDRVWLREGGLVGGVEG